MTSSPESYRIDGLQKTFGHGQKAFAAIEKIDLDIQPGELVVLLGPSGCGKTTALRCLAGLESGTGGRITFGDRVVFDAERHVDVSPDKRGIGMVFQSYALWPHKTVFENIAYPLKVRGMTKELREEKWVEKAAALVDCAMLLDRYPGQLSGGQQQRVALARGIVAQPHLILFDEPLSNLDALLRNQVRNELHELHRRLGFTGVYVTHDQTEAFAIGDRLAILQAGKIDQIGTPQEIYGSPASEYAANFVGMTNRLTMRRDATGWRSTADGQDEILDLPVPLVTDEVHLRFRPGAGHVGSSGIAPAFSFDATVVDRVYTGGRYELTLDYGTVRVNAVADQVAAPSISAGDIVKVHVPWVDCGWYGADGRRLDLLESSAITTSFRAAAV